MRLAVAIILLIGLIIVVVLLIRGCGEDGSGQPTATPSATLTPEAEGTQEPEPVATVPPLVSPGDTVRFETPEGAVVRVTAADYADPGDAPSGITADPGERLVTLKLSVTPEGAEGTAAVPLPFAKADSFLLIAEDDTLTAAQLGDDEILGADLSPGEIISTTLAFSVGASAPIRFVCTPADGSQPPSATWNLNE